MPLQMTFSILAALNIGAKSIGEVCHTPVTAAVVGAVNDALGSDMNQIPLTPDVICAYLAEREEKEREKKA